MVSVRARYQSLITLSISDWISSSVPWRVFSWGASRDIYISIITKRREVSRGSWGTSMTCFLLDFSLEAHSTEQPRRSTVNSGFDWLLPNFWGKKRVYKFKLLCLDIGRCLEVQVLTVWTCEYHATKLKNKTKSSWSRQSRFYQSADELVSSECGVIWNVTC